MDELFEKGMLCEREKSEVGGKARSDRQIQVVGEAVPEIVVAETADHRGIVRAVFGRREQQWLANLFAGFLHVLAQVAVAGDSSA